ncbi:hypothetical protein HYW21_03070 [Candidatus Woesearchaeota archaeon]|nr:hypothetical protein [Candidatus Woesearchaeota archaeon]
MSKTYPNEKDVFFIGAGFSKEYGIPLVSEWFEQISQFDKLSIKFLYDYNWLEDNEKKSICDDAVLQKDIRKIFNLLARVDSSIKKDICKALIYLQNQKNTTYLKDFMCLINWMLYLNYLKYFKDKKRLDFYKKIIREKNTIITPNYDNLIERELPGGCYENKTSISKLKNIHCGFKKNNEEIKYPLILKIHGGHAYVDQSKKESHKKDFLFIYTNDNKKFLSYTDCKKKMGDYGNDIGFKQNDIKYEQIIIPPLDDGTKKKLINSFQAYFDTTQENAKNELTKASRVFVIGYSFNELDDHLNKLFKEIKCPVWVVLPGKPNISALLKIFPRGCKYLQMTAGDFVLYYPSHLEQCFEKAIEIKCPNH